MVWIFLTPFGVLIFLRMVSGSPWKSSALPAGKFSTNGYGGHSWVWQWPQQITECRPPSREQCLWGSLTAGVGLIVLWQCECSRGAFFLTGRNQQTLEVSASCQLFGYMSRVGRDETVVMSVSFKKAWAGKTQNQSKNHNQRLSSCWGSNSIFLLQTATSWMQRKRLFPQSPPLLFLLSPWQKLGGSSFSCLVTQQSLNCCCSLHLA